MENMRVPKTSTTLLKQISGAAEHPRWGEFVAKYRPMLEAFMLAHFPGLDADDMIQETLVALMEALPGYVEAREGHGAFHNFLTGVLRHKALIALRCRDRRKKREQRLAGDPSVANPAGVAEEDDAEWRETVYAAALEQLLADPSINARHKQMFVRTAMMGEKTETVAESMLSTGDAVDKAKRRLTARLREIVERLKRVDGL